MIPKLKSLDLKRLGSKSVALPSRLRRRSHQTSATEHIAPATRRAPTDSPPSCHTRTPSTRRDIPRTDSTDPSDVNASVAGIGHLTDQPAAKQHAGDDDRLEHKSDTPRKQRGQESSDEGTDRRGDGTRGADHRKDLRLHLPLEVAVDERLHRREIERSTEAPDHRPEDDDGGQTLREHHREGAGGIEDEAGDVRPLAAKEVTELAANQDEGGRDQGLQGHRRLDPADGGVEVPDHGGNGDVHERRIDYEDEHRHRQEDAQPRRARLRRHRPRSIPQACPFGHRPAPLHCCSGTEHHAMRSFTAGSWPKVAQ